MSDASAAVPISIQAVLLSSQVIGSVGFGVGKASDRGLRTRGTAEVVDKAQEGFASSDEDRHTQRFTVSSP